MSVILLLLSVFIYQTNPPAVSKELPGALILTGKVLATRCKHGDKGYINCDIDLSLDFSNQSKQPIIILRQFGDYEFWHGGSFLALTKADSEVYHHVYSYEAWPSICRCEPFYLLSRKLDQPTPPADVTRVLAPGESWNWKTTIELRVTEENRRDGLTRAAIGWNEIKKLSAPVWLRVSYEMWPINVENFKRDLGGQLRKRWKKYGTLYLVEKSGRFWFAHLTSEPIELDLHSVELK